MSDQKQERLEVKRLNRILKMLLADMKDLTDEGRDFPIRWHIMHMYSSSQLAKILAIHRGIEPELAGIAAALHDIGAVMTKKHEGHAVAAEKYVFEFLKKYNDGSRAKLPIITQEEMDKIAKAILKHSEKETDSHDPFIELLKDVDSLDRYFHGVKTEGAHLDRCKRVMRELRLKQE
jgi:uncharacterized protein